jgi:serine protease Do
MKTIGKAFLISVLVFAGLVAAGFVDVEVRWVDNVAQAIGLFGSDDEEEAKPAPPVATAPFWLEGSDAPPIAPVGVPGSFADLAERTSPGVVNISTKKTVVGHSIEEFFPFPFGPEGLGPRVQPREQLVPSLGSGFVISRDGHIVTNNHVIAEVDSITVKFANGTELPAKVVGRDPKTDIALIKVDAEEDLFALPLGDSESVRAGEWVVAIGNPFGLEHTVTAGIVSAMHRDIDHGAYDDYIQTDAAINPGNSGGALVDLEGRLVGIPTAILSRTGGYMGVGFAIPSNMAQPIMKSLLEHGHVERGIIGVTIQNLDSDLASSLGLKTLDGVLVSDVAESGPAAKAGIRPGDVVLSVDGKKVQTTGELRNAVAASTVGKPVTVEYLRGGEKRTASVTVAPQPADEVKTPKGESGTTDGSAGLTLAPLDDATRKKLEAPASVRGVVVAGVRPGSPAAEAGISRGDIVVEVGRKAVTKPDDLAREWKDGKGPLALLVWRDGHTFFAVLKR